MDHDFSHSLASFSTALALIIFGVWFFIKNIYPSIITSKKNKMNLPPSPPKIPIIGHLHRIGRFPHRSLFSLSKKHGPLMLLRLGSKPALVVSSADVAKEIFKTHDSLFSGRSILEGTKRIFYEGRGVIAAPYGDQWKKLRSILVHQLLHNGKVKSFTSIMDDENHILVQKIKSSFLTSSRVNLTDLLVLLTNNVIHRSAFGEKHSENEHTDRTIRALAEGVGLVQRFSVGELIPWLSWMDELNGFNASLKRVVKMRDEVHDAEFEGLLERGSKGLGGDQSMGDILVGLYKGNTTGVSIDEESVKALLLDISTGGTETSAKTLEWAMAELIRHPEIMKKLQHEVREVMNEKHPIITEEDLEKMLYLKAVIKETFRCHPAVPVYPRESRKDITLMGYDIPVGSMVLINIWAIGRDPKHWDEPEKFKPERFLNSSIDFKGLDYQFVPFGAGRRICPGISFANASIERVLANLMHKFDWALPDGTKGEDLDMSEEPGLAVGRKNPLIVVPTECYF